MIHDQDRDRFHIDMATYLGADPDVTRMTTVTEISRLIALRDAGAPAAALAEAEGLVVACLAYLQTVVGHDDLADALTRAAAGCRRRAALEAEVIQLADRRMGR